jgi:uncharacterized membrane protein
MHLKNEIRRHEYGVNLPTYERVITSAIGIAAIAFGVREGGVLGWALAASGLGLAARGISGRCPVTRRLARANGEREMSSHEREEMRAEGFSTLGSSIQPQM